MILIFTRVDNLQKVKLLLDEQGISMESAEIEYVAKDKQTISDEEQEKIDHFIEEIEDLEDVNDYYSNINF